MPLSLFGGAHYALPMPESESSGTVPVTSIESGQSSPFTYHPHGRTKAILEGAIKPVKVIDSYPRGSRMATFNRVLGVKITNAVGTMACAYVFTVIALVSLPSALKSGSVIVIISWIAQTFLQLVLLSIIMVGQNVQSQASDKRAEETYKDAEAVLHESIQIQSHLEAQDFLLSKLLTQIAELEARIERGNSAAAV